MSLDTTTEDLSQKHATIETIIAKEAQRPHPDQAKISTLKKEKLRIKDELAHH